MKAIYFLVVTATIFYSCGKEDNSNPTEPVDNFDRELMLQQWADDIIIPSYQLYVQKLLIFKTAVELFSNERTIENFQLVRNNWLIAYKQWQYVSMFEIGKAEEIKLRNFMNIFPADTSQIMINIQSESYNLSLPSTFDEQGFPAIDFMLHGISVDDDEIMELYIQDDLRYNYLEIMVNRLYDMSQEVLIDWETNYRDIFVQNASSSATGSLDKLVNDYIFYFERFLRAGKFGIPAGVFSGNIEAQTVEALYRRNVSKELALDALQASQKFFNGVLTIDGHKVNALSDYLDYIKDSTGSTDVNRLVNDQFDLAISKVQELDNDFYLQLIEDPISILEAYDEIQKIVVFLKVDMMQALNIRVDFVDADGD